MTQESVVVNGTDGRRLSPQEIADILRDRILTGAYEAGTRMPTQSALAEEFRVERGTVRSALRALQEEQLLTPGGKGAPPRIVDGPDVVGAAGTVDEPQPTMVALAPRIAEAFGQEAVRIDALCLTAESLMLAMGEPVRLIHQGLARPASIDVRVLLPARTIALAFPVPVESADDDNPVHDRWLRQRNAQGQVLRNNLLALRATHGIDVRVTFRALPFTPPVKLYLLNQAEALHAYYMVTRRQEEVEDVTLDMYDTLGTRSLLFAFTRDAGGRDEAFVEESQRWFDALWATIATDLRLD